MCSRRIRSRRRAVAARRRAHPQPRAAAHGVASAAHDLGPSTASAFQVVHAIWAGAWARWRSASAALLRVPSVVHVAGGELVALARHRLRRLVSLARPPLAARRASPRHAVTARARRSASSSPSTACRRNACRLASTCERWPLRAPVRRRPASSRRLVHVASLNRVKDQAYAAARAAHPRRSRPRLPARRRRRGHAWAGRFRRWPPSSALREHIRFHGFLTQRELRPIVEAAHVAVISSRHEAGPLVVLEAAAAGVPTVGTAVGHIAEWSPHAALAVPCQDPAALAAALESVLEDEDLRMRLANEAHATRGARRRGRIRHTSFDAMYRARGRWRLMAAPDRHCRDAHVQPPRVRSGRGRFGVRADVRGLGARSDRRWIRRRDASIPPQPAGFAHERHLPTSHRDPGPRSQSRHRAGARPLRCVLGFGRPLGRRKAATSACIDGIRARAALELHGRAQNRCRGARNTLALRAVDSLFRLNLGTSAASRRADRDAGGHGRACVRARARRLRREDAIHRGLRPVVANGAAQRSGSRRRTVGRCAQPPRTLHVGPNR